MTNRDWWPNQLDLSVLHKHDPLASPMGKDFNYAEEFKKLDVEALKRDVIGGDDDLGRTGAGPTTHLWRALDLRMSWHAAVPTAFS